MFFLYKKVGETPVLVAMSWLKTVFIVAFVLYGLMVFVFSRQLFTSVKLERFRPGNQESLDRLDRMRRFRLPSRFTKLQDKWPEARADLRRYFIDRKWVRASESPFDSVMTRNRMMALFRRPIPIDRVFLFYHPMLNVIIVDQTLKTCERMIKDNSEEHPAPRNVIIFLTDMSQRDEITSAGAGVVNYLCALDRRTNLYPLLLDFDAGRLFYPLDTTLISVRHRLYYWRMREQIRRRIMKQVARSNDSDNMQPPLPPKVHQFRHNEDEKSNTDS